MNTENNTATSASAVDNSPVPVVTPRKRGRPITKLTREMSFVFRDGILQVRGRGRPMKNEDGTVETIVRKTVARDWKDGDAIPA